MQSPTITLSSGSLAPGFSPIRMTFTRVTQDQNASAPQTRGRQHELGGFRVKTQLTGGLAWILRPCHNRFDRSERDLPPILRRKVLKGALGLALFPLIGARVSAGEAAEGAKAMTKDIVMLHGANEGAWCFDAFRPVFESLGWTCHAPDLSGHGARAEMRRRPWLVSGSPITVPSSRPRPVLLGHSMGAVLPCREGACPRARAGGRLARGPASCRGPKARRSSART